MSADEAAFISFIVHVFGYFTIIKDNYWVMSCLGQAGLDSLRAFVKKHFTHTFSSLKNKCE